MTNAILVNDSDKCFGLTPQDRDSYLRLVTTEPDPDDLLQQTLVLKIERVNARPLVARGSNANVE